jgi:flagellar hook capping protein FlgD
MMRNNNIEVAMRLVKLAIICLTLTLALSGTAWSQATVGCEDLVKSSTTTLRIPFFEGRPGDTVLMPVIMSNDSAINAFSILIEYDTTYLSPVFIRDSICAEADEFGCITYSVDSTYIDFAISGRFVKEEITQGEFGPIVDTVTSFVANLFQGKNNVINAAMPPKFLTFDTLPPSPGEGDTIFYIKMAVSPTMPHLALSQFEFYEAPVFTVDTSDFPPDTTWINGCHESQVNEFWHTEPINYPDSIEGFQVYPETDHGYAYWFRADTGFMATEPDPSVSFAASPTSITEGQTSTLQWSSANADSVVIRQGSTRLTAAANGGTTGQITLSGLSVGTYSYSATAYGADSKTASGFATVTVTGGTPGTGPSISVSSIAGSYNQGELIAFTVTATNTSGSQISLNASSLPANAGFGTGGSVTGNSPLSGDFTWTPDFNQSGLFSIRFTGVDGGGTTIRDVTVQVNELQFDRLFSTSASGNRPVGGMPGRNEIAFPIDLVTAQTVYGVQFDMSYPASIITVDSFATTGRIPEYVVYDNIGATPGEILVVTFGLNNEAVQDTNTTAILWAYLTLDSNAVPWTDYPIYLANGRESVNPDPAVGSLPLVTDSGIVQADSLGDVNLDKSIDVADVVNIVAYIIGNYGLIPRQFELADIIGNDSVNVFDLVADINMIFHIQPNPTLMAPTEEAVIALAYGDMIGGSSELMTVSTEIPEPLAGVQLEINYDPEAVTLGTPKVMSEVGNYALSSNDNGSGRLKLVMYNMGVSNTDNLVQPGDVDLIEIPIIAKTDIESGDKTKIRLTQALMSNSTAASMTVKGVDLPLPSTFVLQQNYPNPFNPTTVIEFSIGSDGSGLGQQEVKLDVFNILGQHVKELIDGSYPVGDHSVTWDATDQNGKRIATGIYLYRLIVGDERKTKKMLFLK